MRILSHLISYFYIIKYQIYAVFKRQSGLNTKPREFKLVVSLTTYPPRLKTVYLAIESLLNQTLKPDKIVLWLSKLEISPDALPNYLSKLTDRGLEIKFVDENIKSYKKLIYAIETMSDYHIVTCDDDFMYPKWFLADMYQSYQRHPDCISTYRGRLMNQLDNHRLSSYNSWQFCSHQKPSYNVFATSGGGAWYPPNSLNMQVLDRLFLQLSPSGDDIWFKAMSLLNQTKTVMVKPSSIDFPTIDMQHSQAQTLWQQNIQENDRQLKAVFDYFNLYALIKDDR